MSRNETEPGTAIASQTKGHRATDGERPAEASQMATQGRHHASAGSYDSLTDDELTADDIRYLRAQAVWDDLGLGGL